MVERSWDSTGLEILRENDFSGVRLNRPGIYVVCFGATWCPVTRRFIPKLLAEKTKIGGTLAIADITDTHGALWDTFRIRITPSILVFQDGSVYLRFDGRRFIGVSSSELSRLVATVPARTSADAPPGG